VHDTVLVDLVAGHVGDSTRDDVLGKAVVERVYVVVVAHVSDALQSVEERVLGFLHAGAPFVDSLAHVTAGGFFEAVDGLGVVHLVRERRARRYDVRRVFDPHGERVRVVLVCVCVFSLLAVRRAVSFVSVVSVTFRFADRAETPRRRSSDRRRGDDKLSSAHTRASRRRGKKFT